MSGFTIGSQSILVVGTEGVVEKVTDDSVTIGGHSMPTRMGGAVRYLSLLWPESSNCDRVHCDGGCEPSPIYEDARDDLESLAAMIRDRHEETHSDSMRFCSDPICREAFDVEAS